MSRAATVLITGANGFLGRHVARALLAEGVGVRGLVRPGSRPLQPGVEPVLARDLADREALTSGLRGVDTVIHLAARVHVMDDRAADPQAEFRRVNVEGTRAVLEDAIAAGATRFVFASSVKAMGEGGEVPWTEETPALPQDAYGASKLEAESLVHELAATAGVHASVLRLPLVYGPGVRANFLRLLQLVDRGAVLPFGAIRNRRSLLYAGNAAAAVLAVIASPRAAGETFLVSDGRDLSTPELIRAIANALGKPARLVPVPPGLFYAAGRAGDLLARIAPFPFTSGAVGRLLGSLAVDPSKLQRFTGFAPPFTVEEGLQDTVAWYRSHAPRR